MVRFAPMGDDVRLALRALGREPVWAAACVLTVALGTGVNALVFGAVHGILLKPLPFPEPERLLVAYRSYSGSTGRNAWSYPKLETLRHDSRTVDYAGVGTFPMRLQVSGTAEPIWVETVTPNFLSLFGVRPARGRGFREEEDREPLTHPVALLSHRLWARRFGADPRILGRSVTLNGASVEVVGVLPEGFLGYWGTAHPSRYIGAPDVLLPMTMAPLGMLSRDAAEGCLRGPNWQWLGIVGRLRPGVTAREARAELEVFMNRFHASWPELDADGAPVRPRGVLVPLQEDRLDPELTRALPLLQGAAALVLVVAAVNLAGLLRSRLIARERDRAVRAVLGAGAIHLARLPLAECAVIGAVGGLLGIAASAAFARVLQALRPSDLAPTALPVRELTTVRLDAGVVALALGLGLAVALAAGLPLVRIRFDLPSALRSEGSAAGLGRWRPLRGSGMGAALQIALAVALASGAALLAQSFRNALRVDPGFDPHRVVAAQLSWPSTVPDDIAAALRAEALDRVRDVAGVEAVALAQCLPVSGACVATEARVRGRALREPVTVNVVSPGFFSALRIPLRTGRPIEGSDRERAVAVLSERTARLLQGTALGERVSLGGFGEAEVVGVVGDVSYGRLVEPRPPVVYLSSRPHAPLPGWLVVRSALDPGGLTPRLHGALEGLSHDLTVRDVATMDERLAADVAELRLVMVLVASLGVLAVVLAAVGLHGLLAHEVGRRLRDLGIRLALGASPNRLMALVLAQATGILVAGLTLGLAASLWASRVLRGFLFGVGAMEPAPLGVAGAVVAAAVLLAAYVPARRAARLDPAAVLRRE